MAVLRRPGNACDEVRRSCPIHRGVRANAVVSCGVRRQRASALQAPRCLERHGTPLFYCVLEDAEIIENHLKVFFDREWQKAEDVPLFA